LAIESCNRDILAYYCSAFSWVIEPSAVQLGGEKQELGESFAKVGPFGRSGDLRNVFDAGDG
jgi:hypothetical protein